MEAQIRVAPEVRLGSTASGLRASLVAGAVPPAGPTRGPGATVGTGVGSRGPSGVPSVSLDVLAVRALAAQRSDDVSALTEVETTLSSLHLHSHTPRRRPEPEPVLPLDEHERKDLHRKAFRAARQQVPVFRLAERRSARQEAELQADGFAAAAEVAHSVVGQHEAAALEDRWADLARNDRVTVIAELDAEFAAAGGSCTCVDAGWSEDGARGYVTVVVRYPRPDIVGERGPGLSGNGRPMLRRRTPAERNAVYLGGLASLALATARHAIAVAVAADDVHVLVVRPTQSGSGLEPVYLGSLSREAVTLRPAAADPLPLLVSAAIRPMSFDGPAHDLASLAPEADIEAVVGACVAALEDEALDAALGGAADGSAGTA
ncbi:hypothetical protein [Intrasporangium flavum]|uniref:hypothetical protein n=1 Tax=Intrasporangium flavum TaxID=1428657 RepID=UPI00096BFD38|nr:hypothetical protein [Intrasporangium flavum]